MPRKGVIIGFGDRGQVHFRYLKLIAGVDIVAIIDSDESQKQKAISLGLPAYSTLDECKEAKAADFFVISVSIDLHFFYLQIIMEHYAKPIFVEKPVVNTIEEAFDLERLAKNYTYPIYVGDYNPRMREFLAMDENPSYLKISHAVNQQDFFSSVQTWIRDGRNGGLLDLIYQDLSCLIGLFGMPTLNKVSINQQTELNNMGARLQFRHFEAHIEIGQVLGNIQCPITIEIGRRGSPPIQMQIDDDLLHHDLLGVEAHHLEFTAFLRAIDTNTIEHPLGDYLVAVKLSNHISDRISKQQQFASSTHAVSTFQVHTPPAKAHLILVKNGTHDEEKVRMRVVPGS